MRKKGLLYGTMVAVLLAASGTAIGNYVSAGRAEKASAMETEMQETDAAQTGEGTQETDAAQAGKETQKTEKKKVEYQTKEDRFLVEESDTLITVKAKIKPFEESIPVVRVTPYEFTSEDLKTWQDAIFPDVTLYEYFGIDEKEAAGQYHNMYYLLGDLEEDRIPAGGKPHNLVYDASLKNNTYYFGLESDEGNEEGNCIHRISAYRYAGGEHDSFPHKACSKKEADALAEGALEELGLADDGWKLTHADSEDEDGRCTHYYSYSRYYDGVKAFNELGIFKDEKWVDLAAENLYVVIENGQVRDVRLNNPMEVLEVEETDAEVLPFEKIYECFKNEMQKEDLKKEYVKSRFSEGDDYRAADLELCINKIEMGLCPVKCEDGKNEFRMVPVWVFECDFAVDGSWDDHRVMKVINALDGSVVDEDLQWVKW